LERQEAMGSRKELDEQLRIVVNSPENDNIDVCNIGGNIHHAEISDRNGDASLAGNRSVERLRRPLRRAPGQLRLAGTTGSIRSLPQFDGLVYLHED